MRQESSGTVHRAAPTYLRSPRLSHPSTRGCGSRTGGVYTGPSDGGNTHRTELSTDGCPVEAPSSRPCLTRTPHLQAPEVSAVATITKVLSLILHSGGIPLASTPAQEVHHSFFRQISYICGRVWWFLEGFWG